MANNERPPLPEGVIDLAKARDERRWGGFAVDMADTHELFDPSWDPEKPKPVGTAPKPGVVVVPLFRKRLGGEPLA